MRLLTVAVAALAITLGSVDAFAGCKGSDLKGKTYTVYYNEEFTINDNGDRSVENWVEHCQIKVTSTGALKLNGKCYGPDNNLFAYISGGKLKISKSCKVTGNIEMSWNGGFQVVQFKSARMTRGKDEVVGKANVSDSAVNYVASAMVQMVKH